MNSCVFAFLQRVRLGELHHTQICILNANVSFAPLLVKNGIELEAILATRARPIIDFETLSANNISVKLAILTFQ